LSVKKETKEKAPLEKQYCPTRLSIEPNQIARSNICLNKVYAFIISKCKKPECRTSTLQALGLSFEQERFFNALFVLVQRLYAKIQVYYSTTNLFTVVFCLYKNK